MIVSAKPFTRSGYKVIELTSDAGDSQSAIREIEDWCRRNNATRNAIENPVPINSSSSSYWTSLAYPSETTAQQGDEIYRAKIVPLLKPTDIGRIVAIDCLSEDYVIAANELEALDMLDAMHPVARIYMKRIGYAAIAGVGTVVPRSPEF